MGKLKANRSAKTPLVPPLKGAAKKGRVKPARLKLLQASVHPNHSWLVLSGQVQALASFREVGCEQPLTFQANHTT